MNDPINAPQPAPSAAPLVPLIRALIAAQKEFDPAVRNAENSHFNNKYVDLAGVIEATQAALNKYGLVVIQTPEHDQVKGMVLRSTLLHESGASIISDYPLNPIKNDPQGLGSAVTYARRYSMMALLGIAPEDDDGNAASGRGGDRPDQGGQVRQQRPGPAPKESAPAGPKATAAAPSTAAPDMSKPQGVPASSASRSAPSAGQPAPGSARPPSNTGSSTPPASTSATGATSSTTGTPAATDPLKVEAGRLCEEMKVRADGDVALAIWYAFPVVAERVKAYRGALEAITRGIQTMGERWSEAMDYLKNEAGFKEQPRRDAKGNALKDDLPAAPMIQVFLNNLLGREEHAVARTSGPDEPPF